MDFRIKCALQHFFSVAHKGQKLNYLMQRYVTKTYPLHGEGLAGQFSTAAHHLAQYESVYSRLPKTAYEFGCGWHLSVPVIIGLNGCHVTAIDIQHLANEFLLNHTFQRFGVKSLEEANVRYLAPMDARNTSLPDGSMDLVFSTTVLEHIPEEVIPEILKECKRLLSDRGICSFYVDYRDHWAYFDSSITPLNFLRYGKSWPLYNPSIHYQNRLRHSDYVRMFKESGLKIVSVEPEFTELPAEFPIAKEFFRYGKDDLRTVGAWFVLT